MHDPGGAELGSFQMSERECISVNLLLPGK
jgi:hypothetical protein